MTIQRHLVFDPASGHLVRDPATGHLLYAALVPALFSGSSGKKGIHTHDNAGAPPVYPAESTVMADAVSDMQAAGWYYTTAALRSTEKFWDGKANTRCTASCREYSYNSSEVKGATLSGVILTVAATTSVDTYRFKFAVSASGTPSDTWSVIHDGPQFEGTTTGTTFFIPFTATLDDYFFLYVSAADYSALALADPGYGSAAITRNLPGLNSGGSLRFVLTS
jgi:hypothetical protein